MKGVIGEKIERYDTDSSRQGIKRFVWLCCSLGMITFGVLSYLAIVEQSIATGGFRGLPVSHHEGANAVSVGYEMLAFFMMSFGAGFWYHHLRKLIWIMFALIWLIAVIWIHNSLIM